MLHLMAESALSKIQNFNKAVASIDTNNKKLKTKSRLSECFTPSDEAFALMILDNELEVWDKQIERKNMEGLTGSKLRIKKKYCSGYSTKKRGWSKLGEKYYNKLIGHIKQSSNTIYFYFP